MQAMFRADQATKTACQSPGQLQFLVSTDSKSIFTAYIHSGKVACHPFLVFLTTHLHIIPPFMRQTPISLSLCHGIFTVVYVLITFPISRVSASNYLQHALFLCLLFRLIPSEAIFKEDRADLRFLCPFRFWFKGLVCWWLFLGHNIHLFTYYLLFSNIFVPCVDFFC